MGVDVERSATPGSGAGDHGLWIDSHCHLQDEYLTDDPAHPKTAEAGPRRTRGHQDLVAEAVTRAAAEGVIGMVCVGTGAVSSAQAVELARSMNQAGSPARESGVGMWATVGLHPHDASDGVDSLEAVLADAGHDAFLVGIGECGLDYHYEHSPRDAQRQAFAQQISLAKELDLALVIHTRAAWDDTFDVLEGEGMPERTIIHCFTGGPREARRCLDLGAVLSFSGVITFKNADDIREAAALCPLDRLLVETDAPFLTPVPFRGTPNEPARVPLVGQAVAAAKQLDPEDVARAATANTRAAFRI
jgi:TatD DNase family protein